VSKLLGHKNVTTTINIYAHQLPDDFDNLAAAMDKAARPIPGPETRVYASFSALAGVKLDPGCKR